MKEIVVMPYTHNQSHTPEHKCCVCVCVCVFLCVYMFKYICGYKDKKSITDNIESDNTLNMNHKREARTQLPKNTF